MHLFRIPSLIEGAQLTFRIGRDDLAAVSETIVAGLDDRLIEDRRVVADGMHQRANRLVVRQAFKVSERHRVVVSDDVSHI